MIPFRPQDEAGILQCLPILASEILKSKNGNKSVKKNEAEGVKGLER
jgi:hypothetical protein